MVNSKRWLVWAAAAVCAASVGATTVADLEAQGLKPLNADEIRQLVVGHTLDHTMVGTQKVAPIYYRADGTRTVNAKAFGGRVYDTKWWTDNHQRCDISARTQAAQCGSIFKRGDDYVFCIQGEGVCAWTFTIRPGNPDGLGQ
jgi:hypothetical protein